MNRYFYHKINKKGLTDILETSMLKAADTAVGPAGGGCAVRALKQNSSLLPNSYFTSWKDINNHDTTIIEFTVSIIKLAYLQTNAEPFKNGQPESFPEVPFTKECLGMKTINDELYLPINILKIYVRNGDVFKKMVRFVVLILLIIF